MTYSRGRVRLLWAITTVFAIFTILTSLKPELMSPGMVGIVNTILLVAFALVHGITDYGAKAMGVFVVVCLVVSNFFENLSIVTGFPFGHYHYTEALGPKFFLVPVTIGGAYFGAGYLAWSVARVLLGRLTRRIDSFARWALPLVAGFLMASWDFMLDPSASTIDRDWIWEHGGGFFGVPFENYLGWLLTVVIFFSILCGLSRGAFCSRGCSRYGSAFGLLAPSDRDVCAPGRAFSTHVPAAVAGHERGRRHRPRVDAA